MNKDEIILMLQRLVDSLQWQLDEAMRQLGEANSKVDTLLRKIEELEGLLVQKRAGEQKQRNITKGLSKLLQNKSEKQTPAKPSPVTDDKEAEAASAAKPREKTNYGAKRLDHYVTEVEETDVDPADPRFDRDLARWMSSRDSVRYELIPMRFIKHIYHVHKYVPNCTALSSVFC